LTQLSGEVFVDPDDIEEQPQGHILVYDGLVLNRTTRSPPMMKTISFIWPLKRASKRILMTIEISGGRGTPEMAWINA
jgi:hypothetical protein